MEFHFACHPGPPVPSIVGETEAGRGEETLLSTHSCQETKEYRTPGSEKPHQLEKFQGPWGCSTLQTLPSPLWCVSMYVLCVLGCVLWSTAVMHLVCKPQHNVCPSVRGGFCVSVCLCVRSGPAPANEGGEALKHPPPPESVSLILAASAAKSKFPQGRLGLRPGRPQITFEVT